jgi:hypothetical protein
MKGLYMKKGLFTSLVLILLCGTSFAQWNNLGPWPNANYPGGTHGIAVDPDGKVWEVSYYSSKWVTPDQDTIDCNPLYVFNADGSLNDIIGIVTGAGGTDTLSKGATAASNCRGIRADQDGNILYVQTGPTKIIKINYATGERMGSVLMPNIGSSPTTPAVSDDGTIYVGPVVGGGTSQISTFDSDLNYLGAAVVGPPAIARTMTVSKDGLTIYWTTFTGKLGIWVYTRPSDLDAFELTDSLFVTTNPTDSTSDLGMSIESVDWNPATGLLWVSNDTRYVAPNMTSKYSNLTWYGVDVANNYAIVDSFTLADPIPGVTADRLPRGLGFSPDGKIAYVGLYGTAYNRIYKFDTTPPTEYNVTFSVDMGVQAFENAFDPTTDKVWVRGDFQMAAGDTANWQGKMFELSDADGDTVYTLTVTFPLSSKDATYYFKYVKSPDTWESIGNRPVTINAANITLPKVWFNDDKTYTVITEVTNTINFTADISAILGVGVGGAFDANQDSLKVEGLDWDSFGKDVTGNRKMSAEDPFNPGIYTTSLTFTSGPAAPNGVGDSTKWKFKAYPDARFGNNGYETGSDRWYFYQADGTTETFPTIVPRIYPLFGPIANDVPLEFNVDLTGAVNRYNGEIIPVDQIAFVGLRGAADFLGNWSSGAWVVSDTTTGYMKVLHKVSGNMWQYKTTVASGTNAGAYEYKFAAIYPGADTANGGSSPLDNEGGFGTNHLLILSDEPAGIVLNNVFGNFGTTDVKHLDNTIPAVYELNQNYPNPFNPATTIRYSIPQAGLVNVKIFNLLGQEVATLVNTQQVSGTYEVNFDASALASGIYFYSIDVNNFKATKKMILMK